MNAPHTPMRRAAAVAPRRIARHRERVRRARRGQRAGPRRARTSSRSASASRTFRRRRNIQDAAIAAIRGGKHGYTPSAGIDELRAAAAQRPRRAARPRHPARRRRRRRRRQAVHRVHDRVGHRLRRRRRSDLSGAGLSDLRVADRRQRRGAGADLPARSARFRVRSGRARSEDHAEDAAADPQHAAEPHRRHALGQPISTRSPRSCASIRRSGCSPTRSIRASSTTGAFDSLATRAGMLERTIICDGASKTWAMTGWRSATWPIARWRRCSRAGSPTPSRARRRSRNGPAVEAINGPQDVGRRRCARAFSSGAT